MTKWKNGSSREKSIVHIATTYIIRTKEQVSSSVANLVLESKMATSAQFNLQWAYRLDKKFGPVVYQDWITSSPQLFYWGNQPAVQCNGDIF